MKCGLASYADPALGTANLEHPEGGQITRLRPLRRPSQPKQHRDFHQADTELTTPRAWRYCRKKRWFKFPIHPSQYQWYEPQSQLALPGVGSDHHYTWFDNYFVDRLAIAAKWLDTHASKASAENYVKVYADTYNLRAASFRLSGLYGPRQFGGEDHGWVANFSIRNLLRRPLMIYGSGKQVRDIVYATDVARAFFAFYRQGEAGSYNIGGGPMHAISLLECIRLIERNTGITSDVKFGAARLGDLNYFVCDTKKAQDGLGWQAEVPPQEGVSLLIQWIRDNLALFHA